MARMLGRVLTLVVLVCAPVSAQVLFHDDFDGTSLDRSKWYDGRWQLGRSRIDYNNTSVGDGLGTLHLSTFDPLAPGTSTIGAEIFTQKTFAVGTGLEMSARVRTNAVPDGLVSSFFADNFQPPVNNEIDFEALSSENNRQNGASSLLLSTWHDWGAPGSAYYDGVHHTDHSATIPGLNLGQFNTLAIRWFPDRTEWYVNDNMVWSTTAVHATGPMSVHLNFWLSTPEWAPAWGSGLVPAATALLNQTYTYDVDWVNVRALPGSVPGDANRDGVVNLYDLLTLAQNFNATNTTWTTGDFDGDGRTSFADLTALAQHYSGSTPPPAPASPAGIVVPEPSLLAPACAAPLLLRRRR